MSEIDPDHNRLMLSNGEALSYDYLVIATGARLAFEEVPGFGPEGHRLKSRRYPLPPKTGYMIESTVSAIVENIRADMEGRPAWAKASLHAICLADFGDNGVAMVALPQFPPHKLTWARKGKWVHLAKIAFEKYFMQKMRTGKTEPIYEKYVLKAMGIERLPEEEEEE